MRISSRHYFDVSGRRRKAFQQLDQFPGSDGLCNIAVHARRQASLPVARIAWAVMATIEMCLPVFAWFGLVAHPGSWSTNSRPGLRFAENAPFLFLIYIALLLACSAMTYKLVEVPMRRKLMASAALQRLFAY